MSTRYVTAPAAGPIYLNADTPIGAFQSYGLGNPGLLLAAPESEGGKVAVALRAARMEPFSGRLLEAGATEIKGVSLGPVELQFDPASLRPSRQPAPDPGELLVSSEVALLGLTLWTRFGSDAVAIVAGEGAPAVPTASARKWRLIQRDYDGAPIVIFEVDQTTAA